MRDQLNGYETAKDRKKQFKRDYPDGRIVPTKIVLNDNEAQFVTYIYKNADEQKLKLELATGHAQEFKGVGGFANKTSWCENCEESSVGRALDNAGYNNGKCSLEEMNKVERATVEPEPPTVFPIDDTPIKPKRKPVKLVKKIVAPQKPVSVPVLKFARIRKAVDVPGANWSGDRVGQYLKAAFDKNRISELNDEQYNEFCDVVEQTPHFMTAFDQLKKQK